MGQCNIYSDPKKRFDKLKELHGCTRCGLSSHEFKACHYSFTSKCRQCEGNHMTYLCLKATPKFSETTTNLNITELKTVNSNDSIIPPTFTCIAPNKILIYAFKDGGSQKNFILAETAKKCNYLVIDKVHIRIQGFVASKTIKTNLVKFSVLLKDVKIEFDAIVIPNISVDMKLPGLQKVVHSFLNKGCELADSSLANNPIERINDIELIIGAQTEHLLINYNTRRALSTVIILM